MRKINEDDLKDCDVLIHLASAGVSTKSVPLKTMVEVNVMGTIRLAEIAHNAGVKRLVIAGTCHEYGYSAMNYEAVPSDAPLQPSNLYAGSKAAGFELVSCFARVHKLELYYGRIFSAYGEGQFEGNFWPSLRRAASEGSDFPMTKGNQIRDFMPVQEVATRLVEASIRTDLQSGKPYVENIGSGRAISLFDFAKQEWKRLGATGHIILGAIDDRPDEVQRFAPALSKN